MTTLIFVRHGQSETNLTRVFTGQMDAHLTALGREQAERTALYLDRFPITTIWASDLSRAMETAAPTAKRHGLTVHPDARLREIYGGAWEGLNFEQLSAGYPDAYRILRTDVGFLQCPGGENYGDVYRRVTACVDEIVRANAGGCIAIFSHATPLRAMGCFWKEVPTERAKEVPGGPNACVTVTRYDDDLCPTILQYAFSDHLNGEITVLPVNL